MARFWNWLKSKFSCGSTVQGLRSTMAKNVSDESLPLGYTVPIYDPPPYRYPDWAPPPYPASATASWGVAEWIPIEAPVLDLSAPPFYTAVLARVNKIINMYMRDAVHFIVAHHRLDHASALTAVSSTSAYLGGVARATARVPLRPSTNVVGVLAGDAAVRAAMADLPRGVEWAMAREVCSGVVWDVVKELCDLRVALDAAGVGGLEGAAVAAEAVVTAVKEAAFGGLVAVLGSEGVLELGGY